MALSRSTRSSPSTGAKDSMDAGKKRIDQSLSKMLDRKVKKAFYGGDAAAQKEGSRRGYRTLDVSALADCDLVVEAITENPRDQVLLLFKDLARVTCPDCILASNTSSLSIKEMAVA
ncbi:unnamed protein product [Ectocarpus sp. 6 AP-2014]